MPLPLLALLLLASPAMAGTCLERVRETAEALRPGFPGLRDKALAFELFDSDEDFYRAFPERFWNDSGGRVYVVRVNRRACADPPPRDAEEAILAHELAHLEDYARSGRLGLLGRALTQLLGGDRLARSEREADLAAVSRGKGPGLARFREWLYERVSPEVRARKRRIYYTPEELRALDRPAPAL